MFSIKNGLVGIANTQTDPKGTNMGSKASGNGPGGVPWAVIVPVVHAAFDIVTSASCPSCGTQVVLYVCPTCRKIVWPNRGDNAAA